MEALAAVGLAGNILSFLDFAGKLFSGARSIYESSTNQSDFHDTLESISNNVTWHSDTISALPGSSTGSAVRPELRRIATQCTEIAEKILSILVDLRGTGRKSKWTSFVQAVKSANKKDTLDGLATSLDRLQTQVNRELLFLISNQQSDVYRALQDLEACNKQLDMVRTKRLDDLQADIRKIIDSMQCQGGSFTQAVRSVSAATDIQSSNAKPDIAHSLLSEALALRVSDLLVEGQSITREQAFLASLQFDNIEARFTQVRGADTDTFEWIFKKTSEKPWCNVRFVQWLEAQSGIYWVEGKAGSGKSTLMKFLWNHEATLAALKQWASPKRLITAQFFFWNAGTQMQKSLEGLLRSILYYVLKGSPDLISHVYPQLEQKSLAGLHSIYWDFRQLKHAMELLKAQPTINAKFCFFIDGLDEYDGEPDELVQVLQDLTTSDSIKICASSRPWYIFKDSFEDARANNRHLALESLTRDDIRQHINLRFDKNKRFVALKKEDARYKDLVNEIVEKAQGVFLWVFLVVRSLLRGFTQGDRISDLQKRLGLLPRTLEEYFQRMFDQIEQEVYAQQTARLFLTLLEAQESPPLTVVSLLDDWQDLFPFGKEVAPLSYDELQARNEEACRQIDGRCAGLIEIVESTPEHNRYGGLVVFMHRTVLDFLLTKDINEMLLSMVGANFEPLVALNYAYLATMKCVPSAFMNNWQKDTQWLSRWLLYEIAPLWMTYPKIYIMILDEAARTLDFRPQFMEASLWFLPMIVEPGLAPYLSHRFNEQPELATGYNGQRLLGIACDALDLATPELLSARLACINVLLDHGTIPNEADPDGDKSAWEKWLDWLDTYEHRNMPMTNSKDSLLIKELESVTAKFLSHGAFVENQAIPIKKAFGKPTAARILQSAKPKASNEPAQLRARKLSNFVVRLFSRKHAEVGHGSKT